MEQNSQKLSRFMIPTKLIVHSNKDYAQQEPKSSNTMIRRQTNTFLTESNKKKTAEQQVQQSHLLLMNFIDNLDTKVNNVISTHDSKFILAYNNHLNTIKKQMQHIKSEKGKDNDSFVQTTSKSVSLQKMLIIFRQEALKYSNRLNQKDKQVQILKMKVYQLQTQQKYNQNIIKDLMKKNKYLEGLNKNQHNLNQKNNSTTLNQKNNNSTTLNQKNNSTTQKVYQKQQNGLLFLSANARRKLSFIENSDKKFNKKLNRPPKINSFFYENSKTQQKSSQKPSNNTTSIFKSRRTTINLHRTQLSSTKDNFSEYFQKSRNISKILKDKKL